MQKLVAFLAGMARNDPIAAIILLGGLVVPELIPIRILSRVYFLAWWTLLACLIMATSQGRPLGVGEGLSEALRALLAPRRKVATGAGDQAEQTESSAVQRSEAAERLRGALRAYVSSPEEGISGSHVSVSWTGARVSPEEQRARELEVLATLEQRLCGRVRGQDHVHRAIARHLLRQAAGVREQRRRPILSALFAGPTGTGKTETARALAEILGRPLVVYDMGNYAAPHDVAGLIGAPPGYVGSDRPGRIVTDLRANPDAVLLFDELEKAYPTVYDVLLPALDEGRVREQSQGLVADCSNAIFIFTTNLLAQSAQDEAVEDPAVVRRMLVDAAGGMSASQAWGAAFKLRPEFVNRIDVVVLFRRLPRDVLAEIARSYLSSYASQVAQNQRLPRLRVEIEEAVIDAVLDRCNLEFGARDMKRAVDALVGDALVDAFIPWLARTEQPSWLLIAMRDGRVTAEYGVG